MDSSLKNANFLLAFFKLESALLTALLFLGCNAKEGDTHSSGSETLDPPGAGLNGLCVLPKKPYPNTYKSPCPGINYTMTKDDLICMQELVDRFHKFDPSRIGLDWLFSTCQTRGLQGLSASTPNLGGAVLDLLIKKGFIKDGTPSGSGSKQSDSHYEHHRPPSH